MSTDETTEFRLNQIDEKLDNIDSKFEAFGNKLDVLRNELNINRCSQPNLCVVLKVQIEAICRTMERLNSRLEEYENTLAEHKTEIENIITLQKVGLGVLSVVGCVAVFFNDQIIKLIKSAFGN